MAAVFLAACLVMVDAVVRPGFEGVGSFGSVVGACAPGRRAYAAAASQSYRVRSGDTLWSIARRFGTTVKQLQVWNGLKGTLIRVGQTLRVSASAATAGAGYDRRLLHRVSQGETLELLAARYGVTPSEIVAANPGKAIVPGSVLVMPYPSLPVTPMAHDPGLPDRLVSGYYAKSTLEDTLALATVRDRGESLDLLVFASHRVRADGSVDGTIHSDQVEAAGRMGGRFLLMFTNQNGGRFDRDVVHALLRDPASRMRAVAGIRDVLRGHGALGVNVDFENVPPEDRRYLSQFLRELADGLHPEGFLVSVSVPAKLREDPLQAWSGAFDYPLIARICDLVFVMAYDQHYATGYAGPVAGIDWVRAVVDYGVTAIPAEKFILGTPAYGYDWRVGYRGARAVPAFKALEMASSLGLSIGRHPEGQVPFFKYKERGVNRVVYFEDAESLALKIDLVKSIGLRGIALWRLGYEDPAVWGVVADVAPARSG
jgi:spore germination protein